MTPRRSRGGCSPAQGTRTRSRRRRRVPLPQVAPGRRRGGGWKRKPPPRRARGVPGRSDGPGLAGRGSLKPCLKDRGGWGCLFEHSHKGASSCARSPARCSGWVEGGRHCCPPLFSARSPPPPPRQQPPRPQCSGTDNPRTAGGSPHTRGWCVPAGRGRDGEGGNPRAPLRAWAAFRVPPAEFRSRLMTAWGAGTGDNADSRRPGSPLRPPRGGEAPGAALKPAGRGGRRADQPVTGRRRKRLPAARALFPPVIVSRSPRV